MPGPPYGNYWHFDTDKPFVFTLEPAGDIPEVYRDDKTDLQPLWKESSDSY